MEQEKLARKKYWNDSYVKYWKEKVSESNSDKNAYVTPNDVKAAGDLLACRFFEHVKYTINEKLLDYGCGFGRFYDYFNKKGVQYYGIDISEAMIEEAIALQPDLKGKLTVSEGENLPFPDDYFDKIICWGVFDACYQESALEEMIRVCKKDGEILITGKNSNYYIDDNEAYIAEKNARAKGHPNYFTDSKIMIERLKELGMEIVHEEYYERRSDSESGNMKLIMPSRFYTWQIIIKKNIKGAVKFDIRFSNKYSHTWYER